MIVTAYTVLVQLTEAIVEVDVLVARLRDGSMVHGQHVVRSKAAQDYGIVDDPCPLVVEHCKWMLVLEED
jgi:hypothetical protein